MAELHPDERHRAVIEAAWRDFGDPRSLVDVQELSAMVSTNRVYRLVLDDGAAVIGKTSSFGSFFLFAEDHERLHLTMELLRGTRFDGFLAGVLTRDGVPYFWYDGETWAVFYADVAVGDRLPAVLEPAQVGRLGEELASFHLACAAVAPDIPAPSKTAKSDTVNLYERLESPRAGELLGLDRSRIDLVRRHAHRLLMAMHDAGYDRWTKMPVLIDWNLGNFSVVPDDGSFRLFSRWDYDWFRIESRLLDFYFLSRVSSQTGDRSEFTYGAHTMLQSRFRRFLRSYHAVYPLTEPEVLFLPEAYRFFLLNYVIRQGRHFFRPSFWQHLLHDAVDLHLPVLDSIDFRPLLDELD